MKCEPEAIFVTSAERLHLLGAFADKGRAHLAPIAELLGKGVALTIVPQGRMFGKIRFPAPPRKGNWLAIVGDDLCFAEGAAGFHLRTLRKLLGQAHFVAVMAGAPVSMAYQGAADIAAAGLNVVLIETQPAEEGSWLDFVRRHAPAAAKQIVTPNAKAWRNAA